MVVEKHVQRYIYIACRSNPHRITSAKNESSEETSVKKRDSVRHGMDKTRRENERLRRPQ
jgi:hypothetical protein